MEVFRPDIKLNVYFGGKLGMTANDVQDMIRQYKAFGDPQFVKYLIEN